jgi:hypothetical protein
MPHDADVCPECGSESVAESYPEIPDLSDVPGLALVFAAESRIPRSENGAMLHRDMVAWLRLHGVRRRADVMQFEEWFVAIGSVRAKAIEDLTDTSVKKKPDEDEEG